MKNTLTSTEGKPRGAFEWTPSSARQNLGGARSSKLVMRLLLFLIGTARAASAVVFRHDWRTDAFDLLVFLLDLLRICLRVGVQPGLAVLQGVHDLFLLVGVHLLAEALVLTRPLCGRAHGVDVTVKGVFGVHTLLDLLVLVCKMLRLLDHLLYLLLREPAFVVGDRDLLTLAGALVLGPDIQDAVGIDLKGHLDLGLATGCGRNSPELELAKEMVIFSHWSLALVDLDVHGRLVVLVGGEDLRLLRWDHGVAADELGHHTTDCLDTQRQGRHVKQQQVLPALAAQNPSLHSRAICDSLVGVDTTVWLLPVEEVLDELLHLWDAGGAADEDNLVDLILLQAGVLQHLLHWAERVLEQIVIDLLKPSTCKSL